MRTALSLLLLLLTACGSDDPAGTTLSSSTSGNGLPVVVFMGDSITQFWEDGGTSYPTANPTLDERLPGAIDVGVAGQWTYQMLARFQTDVLDSHPSVVVILGGTNDLLNDAGANTDSLAQMADMAAAAGVQVILGTVPPLVPAEVLRPGSVERFNESIETLAATHGYQVADYYRAMLAAGGTADLTLFLADEVHPDDAGYAVMWAVIAPLLQEDGVIAPAL